MITFQEAERTYVVFYLPTLQKELYRRLPIKPLSISRSLFVSLSGLYLWNSCPP